MEQVFNNYDDNLRPKISGQVAQLEKLERDLNAKKEERLKELTQTGTVTDIAADAEIQTIDQAIHTVQTAREQIDPRITNHLARAGKIGQEEQEAEAPIQAVDNQTVAHIKAMRAVASDSLKEGEQFKTMEAYASYMKTNISGLWALTDTKQLAV